MSDMSSGTGEGLLLFLDWTIEKSELPRPTASALKTASKKVLSVEEEWQGVNLRGLNTEDLLRRFSIRSRSEYTEKSLTVYRQRFTQAVNMYLTYLDDGDWRPRHGRTSSATRNGAPKNATGKQNNSTTAPHLEPATQSPVEQAPAQAAPSVHAAVLDPGLIEYPFPIRPGLRARLILPDDLTSSEAERVAAFIKTLAFDTPAD